jgi:uncharacterized lipoprotein YajG
MIRSVSLAALLTSSVLAACSQQVVLNYVPSSPPSRVGAGSTVSKVSVKDQRSEQDPTWIGAIRGGYGNPLKVLHLSEPLRETVANAFRDALKARGLLAPDDHAPYDLSVSIVKFASTQMVRREAEADLVIDVIDRATGGSKYHDEVSVDLVTGSILALDTGILASPSDLQAVAQNALNQAIDQLLEKPGFLSAVYSGTTVRS